MADDVLTRGRAKRPAVSQEYPEWSEVSGRSSVFDNKGLPKEGRRRRAVEPASPAKVRNSKKVKREKIPLVPGQVSPDTKGMTEREQTITSIKQAFLTLSAQDRRALASELMREFGANASTLSRPVRAVAKQNGVPAANSTTGAAAPRHPLPPPPPGLSWPNPRIPGVADEDRTDDDYDRFGRFKRPDGLKDYLRDVWSPQLLASIDMPTFRDHWPKAAVSIDQQRPKLEAEGIALPATMPEVTDRKVAASTDPDSRPWRVERALQARDYRFRKKLANASPS